MRGGEGVAVMTHFFEGEKMKNCRILAEIVLPPGASIGEHTHENEDEYFICTQGSGVYFDDGKETPITAGDVTVVAGGHSHGIKNTGGAPLAVHAIVVTW
jgi:mannose-6-phosphate isomerase-like protein (cupin superfamily)